MAAPYARRAARWRRSWATSPLARRDYDDFLELWKDADLPLQAEVQAARRARDELTRPAAR